MPFDQKMIWLLEGSVEKMKTECGRRSLQWGRAGKDMMDKQNGGILKTVCASWTFLLEDKVDRPSSRQAAEVEECSHVLHRTVRQANFSDCCAGWCVTCTSSLTTQLEVSGNWRKRTMTPHPNSWPTL